MNSTVTYRRSFAAIHTADYPWCPSRTHGHRWIVGIVVGQGVDPKTGRIRVDIDRFIGTVDELEGEDINFLIPAIHPTPENLAAYLAERLRPYIAGLQSVTVDMDAFVSATVSFKE